MFCEILLNRRLSESQPTFTYSIPDNLLAKIIPGQTVIVPFQKSQTIGFIFELHDRPIKYPAKEILSIQENYLSTWQLELLKFISAHYFASLFNVLSLFLPPRFWTGKDYVKKEQNIILNLPETETLNSIPSLSRTPQQKKLLQLLVEKKYRKLNDLKNYEAPRSRARSISHFFSGAESGEVPPRELGGTKTDNFSALILKKLIQKNLVKLENGAILNPLSELSFPNTKPPLSPSFNIREFLQSDQPTLYKYSHLNEKLALILNIISETITQNKQIFLLVPEVSYIQKYLPILWPHFSEKIAVLHGNLNFQDQIQNRARIKSKDALLIIGTRLGLFAPYQNLNTIIVDDEHSTSYKKINSPRFHCRNIALKIHELTKIPTILLSHAPSLASYNSVLAKKFHFPVGILFAYPEKINPILIDLRNELKKKNFTMLSEKLQEELMSNFKHNKLSLLFLGRKGNASSVVCRDCGYTPLCPHCKLPLVYYQNELNSLRCHHCNFTNKLAINCPNCHGYRIKFLRPGLEKLISDIKKIIPRAKITSLSSDNLVGATELKKISNNILSQQIDILIGTQKILSLIDLPQINLIGLILADIGLNYPYFRTSEYFFQLISLFNLQNKKTLIQTYNPENAILQSVVRNDYFAFAKSELEVRKKLNYPPFGKIIKLIYRNSDEKQGILQTKLMIEKLKKSEQKLQEYQNTLPNKSLTIYSPISRTPYSAGKYQNEIIIKGQNPAKIMNIFPLDKGWKIDIDE